jgi:hypothetical protein
MPHIVDLKVAFVGTVSGPLLNLRKSHCLKSLYLRGMALDRSVLLMLSDLPAIENLQITDCHLLEGDLLCLTNVASLRYLSFNQSGVSLATIDRLRAQLPRCTVHSEDDQ